MSTRRSTKAPTPVLRSWSLLAATLAISTCTCGAVAVGTANAERGRRPLPVTEIRLAVAAEKSSLLDLYRELHRNPELSGREVKTSARMAREMRAAGLTVTGILSVILTVAAFSTACDPPTRGDG